MKLKKIRRAIVSVSDKSDLKLILSALKKFNVEIISTGSTFKKIKGMKYNCIEVSSYTGFSEMLDGRIKTLHPKIHAGILNIRNNKKHRSELKKLNISNIDLVIVGLYPFEEKIKKKINTASLIEHIDIGGATLLRAAAKNFNDVTVISDISDYPRLAKELKINKGFTSINFRKLMSSKTFALTAYYDSVISNWINDKFKIKFPEKKTIHGKIIECLRYGENPHQQGMLYGADNLGLEKIHGKNLSYNNYNDIFSALSIINSFKKNKGAAIIKHGNPCGASIEKDQFRSFKKALMCDPVSAFGGVVAINSIISKKLALELNKTFFEVIVSKGFRKDALNILSKRKNIRLIDCNKFNLKNKKKYLFFENSFLAQDLDNTLFGKEKLQIVTRKKPTANQLDSLKFAFTISKFVMSNAIVLVNKKTTIGIGSGQPSRLDSCKIATNKALQFLPEELIGSVAASDAFFPFPDGIEELVEAGVKAIIQPGGSKNDKEIIKAANRAGITMIFTGIRHFKH